jgi:hypothetical protein
MSSHSRVFYIFSQDAVIPFPVTALSYQLPVGGAYYSRNTLGGTSRGVDVGAVEMAHVGLQPHAQEDGAAAVMTSSSRVFLGPPH